MRGERGETERGSRICSSSMVHPEIVSTSSCSFSSYRNKSTEQNNNVIRTKKDRDNAAITVRSILCIFIDSRPFGPGQTASLSRQSLLFSDDHAVYRHSVRLSC